MSGGSSSVPAAPAKMPVSTWTAYSAICASATFRIAASCTAFSIAGAKCD
jgi:hypothetical protein